MGTGMGYGRNDNDTLADAWRRRVAGKKKAASEPKDDPVQNAAWAREIIEKIRVAVANAVESQVVVGEFRGGEIPPKLGEFYPTRGQLKGGALLVFDFCEQEGLHLFVGGDFKMSGYWNPPYEIIVRLER